MEVTSEIYRSGKTTFSDRISSLMETKKHNSVVMSKSKYYELIDQVKESKNKVDGKLPVDYYTNKTQG